MATEHSKLVMNPLLPLLWLRALYARWALQYIPPLLDGQPNRDYMTLSRWATDARLARFLRGE